MGCSRRCSGCCSSYRPVGHRSYNADQADHHERRVTYGTYLTTAHFGEATFENWESEFPQMGAFVVLAIWLHQKGSREFSSEQTSHGGQAVGMWTYITTSQSWFESLQNWQSEFLAVAALMLATVWLRQQGSSQSKPVHQSHAAN